MTDNILDRAYKECLQLASSHYENFPTASRLLPGSLRNATAAIYSFARRADDFADEGEMDKATRHQQLDTFSGYLQQIKNGIIPDDLTFIALADVIKKHHIPVEILERLLTAFRMDVDKNRYSSFQELKQYCHCSADPVGELVLRLHGLDSENNIALSNMICTSLQLINFIQDLDEDLRLRNRIYIPADEMQIYGITEDMLMEHHEHNKLHNLITFQITRAKSMLLDGSPLIDNLSGRLRWVIKLTLTSGLKIVNRLQHRQNIYERPSLKKYDWPIILFQSLYFRSTVRHARISSSKQSS